MSYVRPGDRVTVTSPQPHHAHLDGLRGTVNYVLDGGVLLDLDNGDQEFLFDTELLVDRDADERAVASAERILARLGQ